MMEVKSNIDIIIHEMGYFVDDFEIIDSYLVPIKTFRWHKHILN